MDIGFKVCVSKLQNQKVNYMVLLFLLALFLAWPTSGLSIIAYIAFAVFKSHVKAKARIHYANERHAQRTVSSGKKCVPSWAGDKTESQVFVETIQQSAMRQGVPQAFLWGVLADKEAFETLIHFAGAMEREGSSFLEQQFAVADRLVELWKKASNK